MSVNFATATNQNPEPVLVPLFELGNVRATPGALDALSEAYGQSTTAAGMAGIALINRHVTGDWSEMTEDDQEADRAAVEEGTRVFSRYTLHDGVRIWIITEADRSDTCLLLPEEY